MNRGKLALAIQIRKASLDDLQALKALFREIAANPGGFARTAGEITDTYLEKVLNRALPWGLALVAVDSSGGEGRPIALIFAYLPGPRVFDHVLSELTIGVHPSYQRKGIGRQLFTYFLEEVMQRRTDIMRVELIARESNQRAIGFYESLGFQQEGRFEKRIRSTDGGFEADIPMAWFNPNFSTSCS